MMEVESRVYVRPGDVVAIERVIGTHASDRYWIYLRHGHTIRAIMSDECLAKLVAEVGAHT